MKEGLNLPLDKQLGWVIHKWITITKKKQSSQQLLIMIDAVNEIINVPYDEGEYPHNLEWLFVSESGEPQLLPSGVHLIVSTLKKGAEYPSGTVFHTLQDRMCLQENIPLLDRNSCKQLVKYLLERAHKTWDEDNKTASFLDTISKTGNPLYITLFINELIFFGGYKVSMGVYEQLHLYTEELMQASDVSQLIKT